MKSHIQYPNNKQLKPGLSYSQNVIKVGMFHERGLFSFVASFKDVNEEDKLLACNGCGMLLTWCGANVQYDPCLQPELTIILPCFTNTVWQHATLIEALIRRRAYWPADQHDGRTGHTNHSSPATYWPGGRCDAGSKRGILCSSFRPALNHVKICIWRVRLPLR